jgi:glycosyltransferase involved in cell wall biosynthesis
MISAHRSLRGRIYRLLYSKADAVVCQSEDMVCDMADNFRVPLNKIVKIFNPIDPDELIRLSSGPNPYPVEDPINLITMGRFSAVKRHDFMFHALGEVLKVFPEVKLHLFGDGPLESELRAQTHFLNIDHAVIFHGYLANPFPFLRHADLYLLSSDYEGLCNALLEALSLKVPAISRNCPGGVRDVTRYTSLLNIVNDDTPTAFAKAVIAALDSPSRSAPEEEQDFMRDNFGTESVLAKYHDLFGKFV